MNLFRLATKEEKTDCSYSKILKVIFVGLCIISLPIIIGYGISSDIQKNNAESEPIDVNNNTLSKYDIIIVVDNSSTVEEPPDILPSSPSPAV